MPRPIEYPINNQFMKKVMDDHSLSQIKELAVFFGVPESTARKWVRSHGFMPKADTAIKISERLEMPLNEVLSGLSGIKEVS